MPLPLWQQERGSKKLQEKLIKSFTKVASFINECFIVCCGVLGRWAEIISNYFQEEKQEQAKQAAAYLQQQRYYIMQSNYYLVIELMYEALRACADVVEIKLPRLPKDIAAKPYVICINNSYYWVFRCYFSGYSATNNASTMKRVLQRELDEICFMRGFNRLQIADLKLLDNKLINILIKSY